MVATCKCALRRAAWQAEDEPCQKKLPFELWALMKAEGSAKDADAQYMRANCIQTKDVGLLELMTPEVQQMIEYGSKF